MKVSLIQGLVVIDNLMTLKFKKKTNKHLFTLVPQNLKKFKRFMEI